MKLPFNFDATSGVFDNARSMKRAPTKAEVSLWEKVRNRKLDGIKFRRQHPIGPYIADFFCQSHCLVVEVDGIIHQTEDASIYDENRTHYLNSLGLTVMRFTNDEVLNDLDKVLVKIIDQLHSFDSPSQFGL